ncbi:MAG: Crp/Fnr family transcriptional regulator [Alkaliphilus sp.]|nr:Crp/Fnr family transcriptional regulator [bacterium AH-315-G05]PHS36316.1 MAG: Crp/Fnr family transcriptional regulator [Alkaliphilus sp.]
MKNIYNLNSPIFAGMSENDITSVLNCLNAVEKHYLKRRYIWHAGDAPDYMGLVIAGQINIVKEDYVGNRTVIANIMPSHVFGESYSIAGSNVYPVSAIAATNSVVLLLNFKKLTSTCKNACVYHNKLVENMLKLIAKKNVLLNHRLDCITKKTTRQKLAFYLINEVQYKNTREITIPFNREELADYLGVNRSALSRELASLNNDGILSFNKNIFQLRDINKLHDVSNGE